MLGRGRVADVSRAQPSDDLIERFGRALVVHQGRRAGADETRIELDHLMPDPTGVTAQARWRLATSTARLYPPPVAGEAMKAWHSADAHKGRRLLASDLREDNRVVAVLAWHFEQASIRGVRRPHLITAAAVRGGVAPGVRGEHLVALWLLLCVAAAIDRRTIKAGKIGLVLDSGIDLSASELASLGFKRGRKRVGYRGDYYTLPA